VINSSTFQASIVRNLIIFVKTLFMKKNLLASLLLLTLSCSFLTTSAQMNPAPAVRYEYKQITAVESVVPGGLGRSRILTTDDNGQTREKELKNFYSLVGINFDNITNNDRVIVERLNDFSNEGWELFSVITGSNQQSSQGNSSGGIFITRYIFRRPK
jgi:hypothetical protein